MAVNVGVIGVGMIGQDHIRRLTTVLAGARVVAVTDADADRAKEVGARIPGASVHATGQELITDDAVDAVVVCSWGPTHEEYVLAAIAAGKPVFCEKPLATTQEACSTIIDAEVRGGRRLVQVGYMRRYDAAYRAMKAVIDSGQIGSPLLVHSGHRNPSVPGHYTKEMAITDTAVHDFDVVRWLLGEEIVAARVLTPRSSRHGGELRDPLLMLLESESGVLIDVETSVNIRYGYDIRGEVVGEDGTVALADSSPVLVRHNGAVSGKVPEDWRERFLAAYDVEFQEWIDDIAAGGGGNGPTSWDGYAAAVVSDAAVEALSSGERVAVSLRDKPDFYSTLGR
jgi:myo-inositol 2-dehydrogenase / D-chiro-inositol 1-dehydrogenase